MQKGNTNYIYKNDLDKACFQHDMAYGTNKDLSKRTESDKVLKDKAFKIASNPKCDGYQRGLAFLKFLGKKSTGSGQINVKLTTCRWTIIRKLKKKEGFILHLNTIFGGADLADMQLISKYNKGIRFLLWAIDLFSKYAWVVPLKGKKDITIVNEF